MQSESLSDPPQIPSVLELIQSRASAILGDIVHEDERSDDVLLSEIEKCLGIVLEMGEAGEIKIAKIPPAGAAAKTLAEIGDVIREVDGNYANRISLQRLAPMMLGPKDTVCVLGVTKQKATSFQIAQIPIRRYMGWKAMQEAAKLQQEQARREKERKRMEAREKKSKLNIFDDEVATDVVVLPCAEWDISLNEVEREEKKALEESLQMDELAEEEPEIKKKLDAKQMLVLKSLSNEAVRRMLTTTVDGSFPWKLMKTEDDVFYWSKGLDRHGLKAIKGVSEIEASPLTLLKYVKGVDELEKWEPLLVDAKVIGNVDANTELNYVLFESGVGQMMDKRDFVFLETRRELQGGGYLAACVSTEHKDYPEGKLGSGCVRGVIPLAGWIFQPNPHRPSMTTVTYVFVMDTTGFLPKTVANNDSIDEANVIKRLKEYHIENTDVLGMTRTK